MSFILRKKSFASLRSNTSPPPPIDTSALPPLPISVPPTPGTAATLTSNSSPALVEDVFGGEVQASASSSGKRKLFGWGKKEKSHSSPTVHQVPFNPSSPAPSSQSMSSIRSPTHNEDLGSLGLFPTPPNSQPTLAPKSSHGHSSSVATDFSIPRQHSTNFIAPLGMRTDPNSMSTLASSSSFASTALFSDEWESGSDATSAITSSPESGSGLAPRMWKTVQLPATDSPLRRELSRSSWQDDESDNASVSSRRNSTPVPQMGTSLLPDPTTPPRLKRFSTSTLRAAESSPPFDLQKEVAASERRKQVMSTTSVQTTSSSILNFTPSSPPGGDNLDADDEVSPPRRKLEPPLKAGSNGLLFASDEPYSSRRNRIPSIRFEGISMDAVFAEVEKKMQADEPSDKKARRRSRVLSQYKPLDYGDFSSTPVSTSNSSIASNGSIPSLASASSVTSMSSTDSTASQLDRSATPTPMSAKSLAMGNLGDVARPRPYPRRTSSRPKPIDLAAANALDESYKSPNATPTAFASAITPTSTTVETGCIARSTSTELKRSSSLPKDVNAVALAEPFAAGQEELQVLAVEHIVPEICFFPPSPALEDGKEWTGVPPSPTVEHGPFPAPAEYEDIQPVLPSSTSQAEQAINSFVAAPTAPLVTKVEILRPKPNIRVSTRPSVKPPTRKRSTPISPPTPPFSPTLAAGFSVPSSRAGDGSPTTPTEASFSAFPLPPQMRVTTTPERSRTVSSESELEEDALDKMIQQLNRPHTPPATVEEEEVTPRLGSSATFDGAKPSSPLTEQALEMQQLAFRAARKAYHSEEVESDGSSARFGDAPLSLKRRSQLAQKALGGVRVLGGGMGRAPLVQIQPPSEVDSDAESAHQLSSSESEGEGQKSGFEYELERERDDEWEDESLSSGQRDSLRSLKGLGLSRGPSQEELEDEIEATLATLSSSNEFNSFAREDQDKEELGGETPRLPPSESVRSFQSFASDEEEGATLGYLMTRPIDSSPEQESHSARPPRNYSPFGLSSSPSEESLASMGFPSPPRAPKFTITKPGRVDSLRRSSVVSGHQHSDSSGSSASLSSLASASGSEDGWEGEAVVMTGQRVSYASYEVGMAI